MAVGSYPLHSRLDLASGPSTVRWARLHARNVFQEWKVPSAVAADALLVVSELVTNAVRHASTPSPTAATDDQQRRCALALQRTSDHLLIYVYDQDRRPPVLREPSEDAESGRGLRLVDELSAEWGYAYPASPVGKAVWAKVVIPEGAEQPAPEATHGEQLTSPPRPQWSGRSDRVRAFAHRAMASL